MEPTQQGVPLDPSSSQQQPEQQPPPLLPLPHQYLPRPLAVQHLLPPEHLPRPLAVQHMLLPEHLPRPLAVQHFLPPEHLPRPLAVQRLPPPSLPLPPPLPQGLALAAAGGVPWQPQPQQLDGARLHMSMPRPQFHGHIPGVGAAIPFPASTFLSAGQLTPQERQALLDVCHLVELGEGGFADSSACLVRLLQEGSEDVRAMVFNGVMGALQFVMTSRKWHVVFVELLRAPRYYELQRIVDAACEGKVSLPFIASSEHGYVCE
nr:unnamed protein product [Digitaria exilis]